MCEETKTKINKLIEYSVTKDCFLLGLEKAETPRHAYNHLALAYAKANEPLVIEETLYTYHNWQIDYANAITRLYTKACPNIKIAKGLYNGNITENEIAC